jgi:hypothetical protein
MNNNKQETTTCLSLFCSSPLFVWWLVFLGGAYGAELRLVVVLVFVVVVVVVVLVYGQARKAHARAPEALKVFLLHVFPEVSKKFILFGGSFVLQ